jgi:uncharacterized protein (DUF1499 family)
VTLRKMWSTILCMATFGLAGCAGERPSGLGLTEGRLAPCPDSPNCVSSQAESGYASMEPIPLTLPADKAQAVLVATLQGMERVEIVSVTPGYIHAEATSGIFGFVDDVEIAIDAAEGVIDYRSASRMGYGDMNANRERMVEILGRYEEAVAAAKVAA